MLNIGKLSKNLKLKKKFKLKIIFPNQTRISLENFQTKLDLVWNLFTPQIRHTDTDTVLDSVVR